MSGNPFKAALQRGDNALLPYAGTFSFAASEEALLLVTENFTT